MVSKTVQTSQADKLREKLKSAEASVDGAGKERESLQSQLQVATAAAADVEEEKSRLQNRWAGACVCATFEMKAWARFIRAS